METLPAHGSSLPLLTTAHLREGSFTERLSGPAESYPGESQASAGPCQYTEYPILAPGGGAGGTSGARPGVGRVGRLDALGLEVRIPVAERGVGIDRSVGVAADGPTPARSAGLGRAGVALGTRVRAPSAPRLARLRRLDRLWAPRCTPRQALLPRHPRLAPPLHGPCAPGPCRRAGCACAVPAGTPRTRPPPPQRSPSLAPPPPARPLRRRRSRPRQPRGAPPALVLQHLAQAAQSRAPLGRRGLGDLEERERLREPGFRPERPAAAAPALRRLGETLLDGEQKHRLLQLGAGELEPLEIRRRAARRRSSRGRRPGPPRRPRLRTAGSRARRARGRGRALPAASGGRRGRRGPRGSPRGCRGRPRPSRSRAAAPRARPVRPGAGTRPPRRPG